MGKLIFSGVILGAAGAVLFFFTQPTYDHAKTLEQKEQEYSQALDKAAELQKLKQTLLDRYNSYNTTDLDRLQKALPDHVDNVRLILDVDNLATRHAIALQNVQIDDPNAKDRSGEVVGATADSGTKYATLVIRFTAHGTYSDFTTFLNDLESSLRIVDVIGLTITPDVPIPGAPPTYQYAMALQTYWLK